MKNKRIMKKAILFLIVIMISRIGFAQNVDALYDKFKEKSGVESVSVSPLLMSFARLFMNEDKKSNPLIKGVNSVRVLDLEESSKEVKELFSKEVAKLNLNGYETWIQVREDGENVKVIAKMKNDTIKELLVMTTGKDDCALVIIKGKIRKEDIQAVIDDNKIKIDGRK